MFAGLAAPSHLIIVLTLLLFGARRIPELAKGLGTGIKSSREGISAGEPARAEVPMCEKARSAGRAEDETVRAKAARRDS